MKKVERFTPIPTPPSRACGMCRNRMNQVCIEECAPTESYEHFDPDMERHLGNMPKLTFEEYKELPGSMKGKWLFVQQTKILEALNGEIGYDFNRPRSGTIFKNEQKQSVLFDPAEGDPPYPDRPQRED